MKLVLEALHRLTRVNRLYAIFALNAVTEIALPAQTLTTLYTFCAGYPCAEYPATAALVQVTNGDLYGATYGGTALQTGGKFPGTIFKITPNGELTTIYTFCPDEGSCVDGEFPNGLIQAANGDLYGTTQSGGVSTACDSGCGTVFKITPGGALTRLYSFCHDGSSCVDGTFPNGLVQAANGDLYGTTSSGGAGTTCDDPPGCGTVFKITPSGQLTTLYSFCSHGTRCLDGAEPLAALIQAADGDLYGTTQGGGASDAGTIFRITPSGTLNTLYSFCAESNCADGTAPQRLTQASDGDFYGTTSGGGGNSYDGTVFKVSPSGALTTLYTFCAQNNCTDGADPQAGLTQTSNGDLYGTTSLGGVNYYAGTIFKITPSGRLTTVYSFCPGSLGSLSCADGSNPNALVQNTNGDLYGTTSFGGVTNTGESPNVGTVFSLSDGLSPFVKTEPTSGKVGSVIKILGNHLTGATSVTFDGTPAAFKVNSTGTAILTEVPSGATTGTVQVTTPHSSLSSYPRFLVIP